MLSKERINSAIQLTAAWLTTRWMGKNYTQNHRGRDLHLGLDSIACGPIPTTFLPQVRAAILESWSERKMPVQAINGRCLKCGYRLAWHLVLNKTSRNQLSPPAFHGSLARPTFLLHAKLQFFLLLRFLLLRIVIESVTETVNGQLGIPKLLSTQKVLCAGKLNQIATSPLARLRHKLRFLCLYLWHVRCSKRRPMIEKTVVLPNEKE
jgi:hypothetical protein